MQKTNNLDIFKKHPSNRNLVEGNVVRIMKSIQIKNMLELRPLIVDNQMRVLDGQHRLEAAKRLGIPVFYTVQENSDSEDIFLLNDNQQHWSLDSWLNYWVSKQEPSYVKLSQFMKKHNMTFRMALCLLWGKVASKDSQKFKSGKYKFPDPADVAAAESNLQRIEEVKAYIRSKTSGNKYYLGRPTFMMALSEFLNIKAVDFDVFMKKLSLRLDLVGSRTKISSYLEMFKVIYNYKNHYPVEIRNENFDSDSIRLRSKTSLSNVQGEPELV